ncbi:MAG: hypothetical protein ABUS79_30810 [Pseudomonadota bacterium]
MSSRDPSAAWLDEEPPLGSTFVILVGRLLRRGLVSWFVWAPLVLAISAVAGVRAARRISYDATVVLAATEGNVRTGGEDLTSAALRSYVREWAFTGDHLVELMKRYPRDFPDLATDTGEAVESMRKALDVTVSDVALLEDRLPDDPPRTARIGITYTGGTPEQALTMARELANLVVSSTLRRETLTAANDAAAAAALLGKTEAQFQQTADESSIAAAGNSMAEALRAQARAEAARQNLRAAVAAATNARLATRANEEHESLRFDLADAGRLPPRRTTSAFVRNVAELLLLALFGTCLLAGAFDPRVLDRGDVIGLGLTVLAEAPRLPAGRTKRVLSGR